MLAILAPGVTYLQDAGATLEGDGGRRLRVWGSPWQPESHRWAFNLPRGAPLAAVWARVPDDTAVLITHSPPFGVLDRVLRGSAPQGTPHVGWEDLARRVAALPALRLHAFGHVHEAYGTAEAGGACSANASICTAAYAPTNPPVVVDL